jgi:hypothetical protein
MILKVDLGRGAQGLVPEALLAPGALAGWVLSSPEGADVLPASSSPVDRRNYHAHASFEQIPSDGVGVVECGDGLGALVRRERG